MSLLAEILRASKSGRYVLGTVVDVAGSAYRRPGARVLIEADGSRHGMISGGCLDKDLTRHAFAWTTDGPVTAMYDTRGDELHPQGAFGSGCDGVVQILLERHDGADSAAHRLLAAVERAWSEAQSLTLATIYAAQDDSLIGKRIVFGPAGWRDELPEDVCEGLTVLASEARSWRRPRSVSLEREGGDVTALVETIHPPVELLVLGAGDDARPLVGMASNMGWTVRVVDKWPALATSARFPDAHQVVCCRPGELLDHIEVTRHTRVAMMTHNFEDDLEFLPMLLETETPWIGLMGPRRRTANLMRQLLQRGTLPSPEAFERVQTPVGADLGADAPEEVALSVLAGLVASRNQATAGLLRERDAAAIHEEHQRMIRTLDAVSPDGEDVA